MHVLEPEKSYEALEGLTRDAERVLQDWAFPTGWSGLCSGDLGFSSAETYDIEVWMPSYGRYVEIPAVPILWITRPAGPTSNTREDPKDKPRWCIPERVGSCRGADGGGHFGKLSERRLKLNGARGPAPLYGSGSHQIKSAKKAGQKPRLFIQ